VLRSDPTKSNISEQGKVDFFPALFVAKSKNTFTELPESENLADASTGAGVRLPFARMVTFVDTLEYSFALKPEATSSIRYLQSCTVVVFKTAKLPILFGVDFEKTKLLGDKFNLCVLSLQFKTLSMKVNVTL